MSHTRGESIEKDYDVIDSDNPAKPHSVKRKATGEIFTVGDDTKFGRIESFQEDVRVFGKQKNQVILVKIESIASFVQFSLL